MQTLGMTLRRRANAALLAALAAWTLPFGAHAADFPKREIRLVVAAPPGGGGDLVARLLGQGLSKILKQPVIVENKPGADGNIAADFVAKADPDGHTLLLNYTSAVITPTLHKARPPSDFTPISLLATNWTVLVVRADHSAKSLAELVTLIRKDPDKLTVGYLQGSSNHMAAELLMSELGLKVRRIPYKTNAQALNDLASGVIDFTFIGVGTAQGYLQTGKIRALAVTEQKRNEQLPNVPAVAEMVPGYSASGWYGLVGPKGMPADVVTILNKATREVLENNETRAQLARLGNGPAPSTPQEFANFMAAELPRWRMLIEKAGIKAQ
jgi:tripartite-type tricarboxylate transporter receptor subunit TctC